MLWNFFCDFLYHFFSKVKEIVAICAMQIKLKSSKDSDVYQIAVNCNEGKLIFRPNSGLNIVTFIGAPTALL